MTGYSYAAIKAMAFDVHGNLSCNTGKKQQLLSWLETYRALAEEWLVPDKSTNPLEIIDQMARQFSAEYDNKRSESEEHETYPQKVPNEGMPSLVQFNKLYDKLKADARAIAAYSYSAILLAENANRLVHPDDSKRNDTLDFLAGKKSNHSNEQDSPLIEIRNALPKNVYKLMLQDIVLLRSDRSIVDADIPSNWGKKEEYKKIIHQWGDLLIGTVTVSELLNWKGRTIVYLETFAAGAAIFLAIAGGMFVSIWAISAGLGYFGIKLTNLKSSSLVDIVNALAAISTFTGLTVSLVATRAWTAIKDIESRLCIKALMNKSLRE